MWEFDYSFGNWDKQIWITFELDNGVYTWLMKCWIWLIDKIYQVLQLVNIY